MIWRRALPLLLGVGMAATAAHAAPPAATPAIPVGSFNDGVNHWRSGHADAYARLDPEQYRQIADNLLLLQRRSGGWPVNQDPLRVLDAAAR